MYFLELREKTLKRIGAITGIGNLEKAGDLEEWLLTIYYNAFPSWTDKQMRGLAECLKAFAAALYIERHKEAKKEDESEEKERRKVERSESPGKR